MSKRVNIIGNTYSRLTVIGLGKLHKKERYWICECECGSINGVTRCLSEWAEESPITLGGIIKRLERGIPPEKAVYSPAFQVEL